MQNGSKEGTSLAVQWLKINLQKKKKNPPSNAGDVGSIPGQGIKIPHTRSNSTCVRQLLSLRAAMTRVRALK